VLGLTIEHERPCFTPTERSVLLTLADICAFVLRRWQLGVAAAAVPPEPASATADHLAAILHHLTELHTSTQVDRLITTMLPPAAGADSAFLAVTGLARVSRPDEAVHRVILGAYSQRPLPSVSALPASLQTEVAHVTGLEQNLLEPGQTFPVEMTAGRRSWAVYPLVSRGAEIGVLGIVWHRPTEVSKLLHDQLVAVAAVCASILDPISTMSL
jgi:hypothetical protein